MDQKFRRKKKVSKHGDMAKFYIMSRASKKDRPKATKYVFKSVPESLEDITVEWCQKAISSHVSFFTRVSSIDVKQVQNEITGGSGFSGSTLVRINLQYSGNVTGGNPPPSMLGNLCLESIKLPVLWRAIMYSQERSYSECMLRQELHFVKRVIPVIEKAGYKLPKIYFSSIDDKGDRGFLSAVLLDKPTKVKTVVLMEDMVGWKRSAAGIYLTKDDALLCLKNIAILHAKFWGDNEKKIKSMFKVAKVEKDFRPPTYSKFQSKIYKGNFSSTERLQNDINKSLASDWKNSEMMIWKNSALRPVWFTADPLENGFYSVLNEPMVVEMLSVFAERGPKYYMKKVKLFWKKPVQTLIHGDFHGGNHMYGQADNEGKIVAVDHQMAGLGRAATELVYFFMLSFSPHSPEELIDIAKEYHHQLEEHEVTDYSWVEFIDDVQMTLIAFISTLLRMMSSMSPKKLLSMVDGCGKNGKELCKLFENGVYGHSLVLATNIYIGDKASFMSLEEE